ncbi:MAG: RnfABCDGE type electron transport complex subunit G [Bacteroidota bacterium]
MRDYLRLMIVLAVISAVAAGTLALVDSFTKPKIEAFKAQSEASAYQQVLAEADSFTEDVELMETIAKQPRFSYIQNVKIGTNQGNKVGWVCKVASPGYSSNIVMLIGIKVDGKIGKVMVLDQKESPGLGTNVTDPGFIEQKAIAQANAGEQLKVTKDGGAVQAITGATISSRAVLRGVNQVFDLYRWQLEQDNAVK